MSEVFPSHSGGLTQHEEDEIHRLIGPQAGGKQPIIHRAMLRVKDRQVVSKLYAAYLNLKRSQTTLDFLVTEVLHLDQLIGEGAHLSLRLSLALRELQDFLYLRKQIYHGNNLQSEHLDLISNNEQNDEQTKQTILVKKLFWLFKK